MLRTIKRVKCEEWRVKLWWRNKVSHFKDPSTALGVTKKKLGVTDFVISTVAERSFLMRNEDLRWRSGASHFNSTFYFLHSNFKFSIFRAIQKL